MERSIISFVSMAEEMINHADFLLFHKQIEREGWSLGPLINEKLISSNWQAPWWVY